MSFSNWEVAGGVNGETCDNRGPENQLQCQNVYVPRCGPVLCEEIVPPEGSSWEYHELANASNPLESGTKVGITCDKENNFFDFPDGGDKFISYNHTININSINVTCNEKG